jgi:hypothetical protein
MIVNIAWLVRNYDNGITFTKVILPDAKRRPWKDQPLAEERMMNRAELAMLDRKVNYRKNPRNLPPTSNQLLTHGFKQQAKEICIKSEPQ